MNEINELKEINEKKIIQIIETLAYNIPRKKIFNAIHFEREYQQEKIKIARWQEHKSLPEFLLIIEAELEEAKKAWIKGGTDRNSLGHEILQIAAVCVAALEELSGEQLSMLTAISLNSKADKSFGSVIQEDMP